MMILTLIMLISSQLTQSQFAHHQAITFFIILAFLLINLKTKREYDTFNRQVFIIRKCKKY